MTRIIWDATGDRVYETGVDHGVLYIPDNAGLYTDGVAWNGLTTVTESPSGAEATATYADNIKYLNLISAEDFGATIEAFTWPPEFDQFDGLATPSAGVTIGQQNRKPFGLSYRTRVGNDLLAQDYGYKLHLVYGCSAAPTEKAYATVNDTPEAISFSWALTTSPVAVAGHKPTAILTIDSTQVDPADLLILENILYGTGGQDPRLPLPDEVLSIFTGSITLVTATMPTYNNSTHVLTIPSQTGVKFVNDANGITIATGANTITADVLVKAVATAGYELRPDTDDDWFFDYS